MTEDFDAIVVGSGQGGGPLAAALAGAGRKVALVERAHVGGTCVNEGCTPTKTMIHSARVAHLARRAGDFGVAVGGGPGARVQVDMARVRERKRQVVERFRSGSERGFRSTDGLELIMGHGRFTGPRILAVTLRDGGERTLAAPTIVIDVGARPAIPEVPGLEGAGYLTNADVLELGELPDHLVVLGGGYVGVEMAQMFRRFGSRVTVVQRERQLLPREDEDVSAALAEVLADDGVELLLDAAPSRAMRRDGKTVLAIAGPDGDREVSGSHLLVAAGRKPNTDDLGLEATGVETFGPGFIRVDDRLRTSSEGVYALGDVTGGPAFTHVSYDDYRILSAELLDGGSPRGTGDRVLAYTVFTDPELGRVGLSERQAAAQGRACRVATVPMSGVARAIETDETRGLMKAVVDAHDGRILGAAILGVQGGEVASAVQMAILGGVPYTAVRDAPIAHPTLAESLNNLFAALD